MDGVSNSQTLAEPRLGMGTSEVGRLRDNEYASVANAVVGM